MLDGDATPQATMCAKGHSHVDRPAVSHPFRLSHTLSVCLTSISPFVCLTSISSVPRLRRLSYTLSVCLTPIPSVPRLHRLSHTISDCLAPSPSVSHPLRLPHLLFLLVQWRLWSEWATNPCSVDLNHPPETQSRFDCD